MATKNPDCPPRAASIECPQPSEEPHPPAPSPLRGGGGRKRRPFCSPSPLRGGGRGVGSLAPAHPRTGPMSQEKRKSLMTTGGSGRAPNRAMLRAVGFLDEDFSRP